MFIYAAIQAALSNDPAMAHLFDKADTGRAACCCHMQIADLGKLNYPGPHTPCGSLNQSPVTRLQIGLLQCLQPEQA